MKVTVELSRICKSNAELMILLSDQDKQPLSHQAIDRRLCSRDQRLKDWADKAGNRPPLTARRYGNKRALQAAGLDEHQRTTWHQVLTRSLKGMDHALDCNSSKRPAEKRDIKRTASQP
ncbi:MAG: hypothetical protein AUH75_07810 [Gemmatimonadetes bacterium 13_1_40CM_4_65_7]|nr:MAG: hypothetical protein AUH75_07810 [Gemmatimonadetes bacterium 13_1_40CM_4_65_7]